MVITIGNVATAIAGEGTQQLIDANVGASNNFIIVTIYIDDTAEGDFSAIADEDGNTYVQRVDHSNGNQRILVYSVSNPSINATDTITIDFDAATDYVITVATYNGVDTADPFDHASPSTGTGSGTKTQTFSFTNADGLCICVIGQDNNSAVPPALGTGQTTVGSANQGGAEKTMSGGSYEIAVASGSNNQTIALDKTGNYLMLAAEFNAEAAAAGFPHSQVMAF